MEAGSTVNELVMLNINFESEVGEKISSQIGERKVSNDKYPSEATVKFDIQG